MENAPPLPPLPARTGNSFGHQAAKFCLYAPIIAFGLGLVINIGFNSPTDDKASPESIQTTKMFLGAFCFLLISAGAIFGVVALALMGKFGARGILVRSIIGLVLNGGILWMCAWLLFFCPLARVTARITGDWTGTAQANGQRMELHFAKDMTARFVVFGDETKSLPAHWGVAREKETAGGHLLIMKIEGKDMPDGKSMTIRWKIMEIEPDRLSLKGESMEIYTRMKR